jgi:sirohydrochlorin cobaltochelatase
MQRDDNQTGLLLVGHGTNSDAGTTQFLALVDAVASRLPPLPVAPAFLEMREPNIDAAVGRLLGRDINRLITMPLLLFAAGHAKHDIPRQVSAALVRRGGGHIKQVQAEHLGCHPAVVELSHQRMEQTLVLVPRLPPGNALSGGTCLLLVGRGSHDESATAEMHQFARLRAAGNADMTMEVAFLAMARPLLAEQLSRIGQFGYSRVIVQPHLLFAGELAEAIERQVANAAARHAETQWLVTPPLVDRADIVTRTTDLMEKVILDRCCQAGIRVVAPRRGD